MRLLILYSGVLSSRALAMQAQSSGQQTADPWQGLAVVLAIVAIAQRKSAIGGWLLYFFGLIYLRTVATVYNVVKYFGVYSPMAWHDVKRYLLFLNSTVPGYLFLIGGAIAVTKLALTEEWIWVERLKTILACGAAAGVIAMVIDAFYFRTNLVVAGQALASSSVLWAYFARSHRVERVFLTHDWRTGAEFGSPPSIK